MLRRGDAGGADAQVARGRARAGDCAGALVAFDAAIAQNIDPTLRRDRGLCQEKLGHPFPAIDDFRAYLTEAPEAPDADNIRQRLAALEEQAGVGGPSSEVVANSEDNPELGSSDQSASFAVNGEGSGEGTSATTKKKKKGRGRARDDDGKQHTFDYYVENEQKADEAESSPLRYGKGFIIGPYLNLPRYFVGKTISHDFGFNVGVTLRYSLSSLLTVISEVGYAGFGTSNATGGASGVSVMGGLEVRIPVSRYASDQILLRGGPAFESLTASNSQSSASLFEARFGLGFRHIFGPRLGLEILGDGGPTWFKVSGAKAMFFGVVGASTALTVGF
jgi:hypothetical protein